MTRRLLLTRLEGTGVTAAAAHPGVVATSFGAEDHAAHLGIIIRVARPLLTTPAQGPLTTVYRAVSPEVEGGTGQYIAHRKPKASSKASYDTAAAARLWQTSAALTGLTAVA